MSSSPLLFQTAVFRRDSGQTAPAVVLSTISVRTDGQDDVNEVVERAIVVNGDNLDLVITLAQVAGVSLDKIRSVLVLYSKMSANQSGNLVQPNTLNQPLGFRVNIDGDHVLTTSVFQLTKCSELSAPITFSHFEDPTTNGGSGLIRIIITIEN